MPLCRFHPCALYREGHLLGHGVHKVRCRNANTPSIVILQQQHRPWAMHPAQIKLGVGRMLSQIIFPASNRRLTLRIAVSTNTTTTNSPSNIVIKTN